jgi:phosphatidylglycerophosphatase C
LQRLVFFDLDGTITRHGTLPAYVIGLLRRRPWQFARALLFVPALAAFLLGRLDRGELKARVLQATLGGRTRAELQAWTAQFVAQLLARGVRADALRTIAAHRSRGDVLALLSASPDLYVPEIAAQLRFDEVLCTGLSWTHDRLDGGLTGPNRRGVEKTRCVAALASRHPGLATAAYANEAADLDHLRRVDEPLLVCGSWRARRKAGRAGIPCAWWR